jgi:hypothetical protein
MLKTSTGKSEIIWMLERNISWIPHKSTLEVFPAVCVKDVIRGKFEKTVRAVIIEHNIAHPLHNF